MISILARSCPSWTPVKGWQDLGGCWSPPPAAPWWTPHIALAAVALCAAIALGVALAFVRDRLIIRRFLRGAR